MDIHSVRNKISLGVGVCVLVTALIIIWFAVASLRSTSTKEATEKSLIITRILAADLESQLHSQFQVAHTLARTLAAVKMDDVRLNLDRDRVRDILRLVLESNPQISGIYTFWEPYGFDGDDTKFKGAVYHDPTGRFALYLHRSGSGQVEALPLLTLPGRVQAGQPGAWYADPGKSYKEYLSDPFSMAAGGMTKQMVTLSVPILANGTFFGVVGIDLDVTFIQKEVDKLAEILKSENPSENEIRKLVALIDDLREKRHQSINRFHKDIAGILTAVQLGRATVFEERFERELISSVRGFRMKHMPPLEP